VSWSKSNSMRLILAFWVGCAIAPPVWAAADGSEIGLCYAKKATWAKTMLATRAQYRQWRAARLEREPELTVGPWFEAGPFKASKFSTKFPIEEKVDLKAKGADKRRLWQKRDYEDGRPHSLQPNVVGPTYLFRTITAVRPMRVTASLGSDDGIAVWLNGEQILAKDVARGVAPDQERVALDLKSGVNGLLLKIYNMRGGHGFYFAMQSLPVLELWRQIAADCPAEGAWMRQELGKSEYLNWFDRNDTSVEERMIDKAIDQVGGAASALRHRLQGLKDVGTEMHDPAWLNLYAQTCAYRKNLTVLKTVDLGALELAIRDLSQAYPDRYPAEYAREIGRYQRRLKRHMDAIERDEDVDLPALTELAREIVAFQRKAMLANPLLDFDKVLVIRRHLGSQARRAMSRQIGMASLNSHNNTSIDNAATDWDNEIVTLSRLRDEVRSDILYKPKGRKLITDVDLDFDAERLMFSMPGTHDRWQVFEMGLDGKGLRQITPTDLPDVDHFDSCYLPNGRIVFTGTANYQGLPCENGSRPMATLYQMDAQGRGIRQLTFEQDSDWCPTVLNNGRLLYLRWEYSDIPHYFSRILFHMNPDGTGQMEYLGSNSYFPNAFFYARPIPNHPTRVVGIVGGHHGISRSGRLMLFDPAQGRHEASGVVQEIPGRHKTVEPVIVDALVNGVWPQFLHPYPLSDKYFLVSGKLDPDSLWGIYLVDVFDNLTLVAETEGAGLFEPLPLKRQWRPPVVPDKVDLTAKNAVVFLTDVYRGQGLQGVPRGTVKRLRLFSYHFAHNKTGGHASVGVESSWDIKRVLGTVPVEPDGSAMFNVPANTPISVQPLDEEGRALQIMRSWFVGH